MVKEANLANDRNHFKLQCSLKVTSSKVTSTSVHESSESGKSDSAGLNLAGTNASRHVTRPAESHDPLIAVFSICKLVCTGLARQEQYSTKLHNTPRVRESFVRYS